MNHEKAIANVSQNLRDDQISKINKDAMKQMINDIPEIVRNLTND